MPAFYLYEKLDEKKSMQADGIIPEIGNVENYNKTEVYRSSR